ncbi:bifunctional 4-hydroxy-2-oxoglutarate aldolase/2-dehydro-3-deoxy-phosphogluconate aldolase [Lacrimispora sp.]|uniref:bifunctional 4-hydroxy-2-oxoglutarate aldolase/2-dehydro-3-deoxy-phosphogluconate aldolase n=1 Tax=Lacrimispora sp. TaxID=2719234 RepID=UPI0028A7E3E0|nr:bifunctional 4-hydroxy-2-oxoglutarate aldolase/2-dehydro-3-deoxy-phosphogluconate aldolase [Lacrimispora sp.]
MKKEDFPKITVILRGYTHSQIRTVVKSLLGTAIKSVEITMNTPDAIEIIKSISKEFGNDILVGAGTVTTYEEAGAAIVAGARFLLSPITFSKEIIELCKEQGVISVPAALTPSEIMQGIRDGADIIKLFPAGIMGAAYLKDIQAPLGRLPLMVVGGVNGSNVKEFFNAGAAYAGIGSGLFEKEDIISENLSGLKASVQKLTEQLI